MPLTAEQRSERIETIKDLIDKGYSVAQIAQKLGHRENNVRKFLLRYDLVTHGMRQHRNRKED